MAFSAALRISTAVSGSGISFSSSSLYRVSKSSMIIVFMRTILFCISLSHFDLTSCRQTNLSSSLDTLKQIELILSAYVRSDEIDPISKSACPWLLWIVTPRQFSIVLLAEFRCFEVVPFQLILKERVLVREFDLIDCWASIW